MQDILLAILFITIFFIVQLPFHCKSLCGCWTSECSTIHCLWTPSSPFLLPLSQHHVGSTCYLGPHSSFMLCHPNLLMFSHLFASLPCQFTLPAYLIGWMYLLSFAMACLRAFQLSAPCILPVPSLDYNSQSDANTTWMYPRCFVVVGQVKNCVSD